MRKLCLTLIFLPLCLFAQRYTGWGRGSDYDPLFSSGSTGIGWIIFIFLVGGVCYLFFILKKKFGKKEWTYWEFRRKKGNKVKNYKHDDIHISALIFDDGDNETRVILNDQKEYFDIDTISKDKNLIIRWEKGSYRMYKKEGV